MLRGCNSAIPQGSSGARRTRRCSVVAPAWPSLRCGRCGLTRTLGMTFHQHMLPNGLQLIGETSPSAKSVAVAFFVRTGARDESPDVCGVTHFLEHMVFKGTPRRTAWDVNRDFDQIGANYNAFTSEENTVFYAAVLPEYLAPVLDILADVLRPSLRDDDFN